MSRFWLLLILTPLFYSNFYFAVELKINAPFYKNQTIKWQKKTDYISNNHELITSSIIGFTPYFLIFSYAGDKISNLLEIKSFSINNIFSIEILIILIILVFFLIIRIYYKISSK